MDGFDAALARYRAFLASEPIAPLLRRSLALLVPDNIRIDTVTPDDSLRCTTDGTSVTVGGAAYLLRVDFDARHWTAFICFRVSSYFIIVLYHKMLFPF